MQAFIAFPLGLSVLTAPGQFTLRNAFALHHSSVGKESACNAGDPGLIPRSGRSTGEGKGYPLQYSDLENSMDWNSMGLQSQTPSNFHFHSSNRTLCTLLAPKTDTAKNSLQLQQ